jgi:flagellar motility protein MotE (MotC chaperone)
MFKIDIDSYILLWIITMVSSTISGIALGMILRNVYNDKIVEVTKINNVEILKDISKELIESKKTINFILEINNKHNKDVLEEINNIIKNIDNKLDDKITALIEEAQHIEKNKEKDINHFYG